MTINIDEELQHHWSGWPGAYCLKCLREDPMEIALADGDFELVEVPSDHPEDEPLLEPQWKSDEVKAKVEAASVCPVRGTLKWNDETKKWDLVRRAG